MEIGRLEFYATKRDVKGQFFGKIRPFSQTLQDKLDDGLVFFHESCIPRTSSLHNNMELRGYRYETRLHGRRIYADPVYVAFDIPQYPTSNKGNKATSVMLLEEANPDELPDFASMINPRVRATLIAAFPNVYTLTRVGLDIIQFGSQTDPLKACWDTSSNDQRLEFMRSLDLASLEKVLVLLIEIDKRESHNHVVARRSLQALAVRPDAILIPSVIAKLTPEMWVDEFLTTMGDPEEWSSLLSSAKPLFRVYALTKLVETGKSLKGALVDDFVMAIYDSGDSDLTAKYLRTALTLQPGLALRDDVSAILTPALWVDSFIDITRSPAERHALLAHAQPAFRAYAIAKLAGAGELLDGDAILTFVAAIRECTDRKLVNECLRLVLSKQPIIALIGNVAAMLTPDMWVDELLDLMEHPDNRRTFLAATSPEFHAYALTRFVETGGSPDRDDAEGFAAAIRGCADKNLTSESLRSVLDKQPHLALIDDIATMLTPDMWTNKFLNLMSNQEEMQSFLTHVQPTFRAYATKEYVEAGGWLNDADVINFAAAIRECEDTKLAAKYLTVVLARQPRIALIADVASMLTKDMWVDELLETMRSPEEQVELLAAAQSDFRAYAVQKLIEADIKLDIRIFSLCPLHACPILLDQVQWAIEDTSYAKAVGRWLQEADWCSEEGRKLVVSAAERMHAAGNLLSLTMWLNLPAEMGVRFCIFWSNHYTDLDDYTVRGGIVRLCLDAKRNSWRGYDPTLKAALLLLSLPLWSDPREVFLDANDTLIGEIVRQFNSCDAGSVHTFTLSCGLQALLQRCGSNPYINARSVRGFCDGRWWEEGNSVWCHKGEDRPGGGRRKCDSLCSPINATYKGREACPVLENQFMADLLANANNAMGGSINVGPWLEPNKEELRTDLIEYAYRVSGYVNKMAAALPHMVCRGCGSRLTLNYEYPRDSLYRGLDVPALSTTVCSCPNRADTSTWHDVSVYIHYCLNCKRIIDSRECKRIDEYNYYLCMYCGASKAFKAATVCPVCGNTNPKTLGYYMGSMREEISYRSGRKPFGEVLVVCKARDCKYDAREFRSEFE